ncbi:hypothetical protein OR1_00122 [Geobacter sp. OR-1]|uniref:zinc ribbon domain-containing protein n=1 Tax=Geobacter sp. OR-1 TaxID=1266765 RepID=UPI000542CB61|nr:zinc ribbon domain-containing protein [Geobacter sp. OR-1]GAM07853.1 hypothetical protein OR1_00122 [Geobacter sp. OR-1]
MSDSAKNLAEKYDNLELCYKVMGLSFSDPPEKVDKVFNNLMAGYKQKLRSSKPDEAQDAQMNIEQIQEIYERITNSMIYKDYAREYEKYKNAQNAVKEERQMKAHVEKSTFVNCPSCGKILNIGFKTCPYCRKKVYTPAEMMMMKIFSTRNIIIAAVVILAIAAVGIYLFKPELVKFLKQV